MESAEDSNLQVSKVIIIYASDSPSRNVTVTGDGTQAETGLSPCRVFISFRSLVTI